VFEVVQKGTGRCCRLKISPGLDVIMPASRGHSTAAMPFWSPQSGELCQNAHDFAHLLREQASVVREEADVMALQGHGTRL
jgi:hypothetical protein